MGKIFLIVVLILAAIWATNHDGSSKTTVKKGDENIIPPTAPGETAPANAEVEKLRKELPDIKSALANRPSPLTRGDAPTSTGSSGVVRHRVVLPPLEPIIVGTRQVKAASGGGYHTETKTVRPVTFLMGVLGGDPVNATRDQINAIRAHKQRFAEDKGRRERVNRALLEPNADQAAIEGWLTQEAHADGLEGVVVALKDGPSRPIEKWAPQPQNSPGHSSQKSSGTSSHQTRPTICGKSTQRGHRHGPECAPPMARR